MSVYRTIGPLVFVFVMAAMFACIRTSVAILHCLLSASRLLFCGQCTLWDRRVYKAGAKNARGLRILTLN